MDQFPHFLRDFEFTFVPLDHSELVSTRESADLSHVAGVLQSVVVDPARPVELTRTELMQRLGWADRVKYQNPHRFPVPETYTANIAARTALEHALERHTNGYLALIGPPGSGKSTLVESLAVPGRLVRYYAFVPDAPDPFSGRGEAQSFMHDLSLALEEAGLHRNGFGSELLGQREVLFDQLARAGDRFAEDGVRTTIIVDGLDHIPREQNPTRSLLDELPSPAALRDGVCILIGSQTTSILPLSIRDALDDDERIVEVPPLSSREVEAIATLAGVADWLAPGQVSSLVDRSEGHPLVLTYMIQDLRALESAADVDARREQAEQMLMDALDYRGSIDLRYTHYLGSLLNDHDVLSVLGTVCRLRIPVDLAWLETWVSPAAVSRFAERTHTFFRRRGNEWTFIHNSFRRFLVEQTAMVGGELREWRSRELHKQLADRCAASTDWPQYRDEELAQRYLAGQFKLVLEAAVPGTLRQNLFDGRPYGVVRDQALVAVRAAAGAGDHRALLRSLMLLNELNQRSYVLSAEEIAKAMSEVDPGSALEHTVQGRSLRIETGPALKVAAALAASNALEDANAIVRAIGGLQGLVGERNHRQREWVESVTDWAEVTWHRSGIGRVLDELDHLLPVPAAEVESDEAAPSSGDEEAGWKAAREEREAREERVAAIAARNAVHARCFDLADAVRDPATTSLVADRVDVESDIDWRARKHVISARSAQVDGETSEVLRQVQMMLALEASQAEVLAPISGSPLAVGLDDDDEEVAPSPRRIALSLRVASADVLARAGLAESEEFARLLPPETKAAWPTSVSGSEGLAPYSTMLGVFRMRALAQWIKVYDDLPAEGLTAPGSDQGPARRRFTDAITRVAELEAQAIAFTLGMADAPDVPALADPVVRLLDVPYQTTQDWTGWYLFTDAAPDMYARLIELSYRCGGYAQLERLVGQFKLAWDSPERGAYWPTSRRVGVVRAAAHFAEAAGWCAAELQSVESLIGEGDDPHGSATAWLEIAKVRSQIGDRAEAISAVGNAHRYGWGPAQHHDDYQLVTWLAWLVDAAKIGDIDQDTFLNEARTYARRLVVAADGAEGQASEAAGDLVKAVFAYDPGLATDMGEALCNHGVLSEVEMVLSIVKGAAESSEVEPELVASVLTELLMPLSTDTPVSIEDLLVGRSANPVELTERFARAKSLWFAPDSRRSDASAESKPPESSPESGDVGVIQLPTMLRQMRTKMIAEATPEEIDLWSRTIAGFDGVAPRLLGIELLSEAERLALEPTAVASFAGLAARAGAVEQARAALSRILARTKAYGWMRHYDGGSRVTLFEAAIQQAGDELVDLAARDLAGLVASGAIGGDFNPKDLRRFAELFGGKNLVAQCWSEVRAYLDVFAPAADALPELVMRTSKAPEVEVLEWVGRQLGHPVRIVDFGARRVLAAAHQSHRSVVEELLAEMLGRGGWAAEAALHVLIELRNHAGLDPHPNLESALLASASDKDAIVRVLARRLLALEHLEAPALAPIDLPAFYDLDLPPLPARGIPELDRHGVPHVDMTDPQQVIGPFDQHLDAIADELGIDVASLVHRAAALGKADTDRWTEGGHRDHSDRLRVRGNLHTYRPWAYMVGRRGCAQVLAELIDARALPGGAGSFFLDLMIDEATHWMSPLPLDGTTPMPWRDPGNKDYPSEDWCSEASDAADSYASEFSSNNVLAEQSSWRWLAWGVPEEDRWIGTRHGERPALPLIAPAAGSAWEITVDVASRYPELRGLSWADRELVVQAHRLYSDAERLQWLALHPAVAHELGWTNGQRQFEWVGADGGWRARTVLRVRGQLSHRPPSDAVCAEVWQVVLSEQGWVELTAAFPGLERTVSVRRVLPENRREGRNSLSKTGKATIVDDKA
ncbi:ATP-binding protein [Rhodococcus sp. X156]|uniref:ATP-binding protein n=1 Tax=Rhodococcus sp. X156 TaxID=2499145 RepID=UPI000FD894BB|nr:ATP-binding protein [Rhodococcus sp. X156]